MGDVHEVPRPRIATGQLAQHIGQPVCFVGRVEKVRDLLGGRLLPFGPRRGASGAGVAALSPWVGPCLGVRSGLSPCLVQLAAAWPEGGRRLQSGRGEGGRRL